MRTASVLVALLSVPPAFAGEGCIVDYDSLEVRGLLATDPASMLSEQSIYSYDWGLEPATVVIGNAYAKYGLPRVLFPTEVTFYGFKESAPFLREAGTRDEPPMVVYALINGPRCEFQPYVLKPS